MTRKRKKMPFARSRSSLVFLAVSVTILLLLLVTGRMGERDDMVLTGGLDSDQIRADGLRLYNAQCLRCHGVNGRGTSFGPALVQAHYAPKQLSDQAFAQAVTYGVPERLWQFGPMDPIKEISQLEIAQILAYVRSLQQAAKID